MKTRKIVFLVLFLLFSSVCFGADKPAAGFDFLIVPTGLDQDMDIWYKTPPDSRPRIPSLSDVTKGQKFWIALFFSNYQRDKNNNANISFDLTVKKPDGAVYFEQKNLEGIAKRKIDHPLLLLSETMVGISFDPPDPLGSYTIEVTARDVIGNSSKTQSSRVSLSSWQLGKKPGTDKDFDKWANDYHNSPKPNEAVYAFLAHCPLTDSKGELAAAGLWLFKVIFEENPYLIDHLAAQFNTSTNEQRQKIIVLLHLLGKLDKIAIPDDLASFKAKAVKIALPNPYAETVSGDQQDMLWAEFLATGRIKPIRKLIAGLEYSKYAGSIDKYKKSKQTDEDKRNAYHEALFKSAAWSIKSNCRQYELVAKYCLYLYEYGELSANEKKWLGFILSKVFEKDQDEGEPAAKPKDERL